MLSGELRAILQRPYAKGRDIYDLLWYLSNPTWPQPNPVLLNNTLAQTNWTGGVVTADNWREQIGERLRLLNWLDFQADVRLFVGARF